MCVATKLVKVGQLVKQIWHKKKFPFGGGVEIAVVNVGD